MQINVEKALLYLVIVGVAIGLGYLIFWKQSDNISREDFKQFIQLQDSNTNLRVKNAVLEEHNKLLDAQNDSILAKVGQTKLNLKVKDNTYLNLPRQDDKDDYFLKLYGFKK